MQSRSTARFSLAADSHRRGTIIVLLALLLTVLFVLAGFSVDLAYMELVKTELRSATDSAALAAASALVQGKTQAQVQNAAIDAAAMNTVAGNTLVLSAGDILLGQSIEQADGSYQFKAGVQPYQAVQVNSSLSNQKSSGDALLFFGQFTGVKSYTPTNSAVAAVSACDVCLALDRSQSMCWDESGLAWSYPPPLGIDNHGLSIAATKIPTGVPSGVFEQYPPIAGSRWVGLQYAVQSFCDVLGAANTKTNVSVVTWASDSPAHTVTSTLGTVTLPASAGVAVDQGLTNNMSDVAAAVLSRSKGLLLGGTDMYSGLEESIAVLLGPGSRSAASKVIILMTDGDWSSPTGNTDPLLAAQDAAANKITIHCICFTENANQATCKSIASLTGGKFYYASDSASLTEIFAEVAGSMPVSLTN